MKARTAVNHFPDKITDTDKRFFGANLGWKFLHRRFLASQLAQKHKPSMNASGDSWGKLRGKHRIGTHGFTKIGSLHQTHPKRRGGFGRGYVMISLIKITEQKKKGENM